MKRKYSQMKHKYLKDIGIKLENTPYGWCPKDDRQKGWKQERKEYGFDSRETWGLDSTLFYWLYERLMKYNEVNCIDTSFHKFIVNGIEMTQQECIDKMISICKRYLTYNFTTLESEAKMYKESEEVFIILKECIWSLWW